MNEHHQDLFRELYAQAPSYANGVRQCGRGAYLVSEDGALLAVGVSAKSLEELQWDFPDATIYDYSQPEEVERLVDRYQWLADYEEKKRKR